MSQLDNPRLSMELELLMAMYPGQIDFNDRSRDLKFSDQSSLLHLRLPELYPDAGSPDVMSARDSFKRDVRDQVKAEIRDLGLAEGEEALDAIIACFQGFITATNDPDDSLADMSRSGNSVAEQPPETNKTVIIWLHHLLALTKRKLALAPASSVSGITKPGYPGIMIFTGPTSAVNEHVNTLKAENWQAFQVRYEDEGLWEFIHGAAVREVETMAEVTKAIEVGEYGARRKDEFLKAAGIK